MLLLDLTQSIQDLLPGVKSVENWESRIRVDRIRMLMNEQGRLSANKRKALLEALTVGTRPPKEFLEGWGYTAKDYRDPIKWVTSLRNGEPGAYLAFLKQRLKMLELGALAWLGEGRAALSIPVKGKLPIPMPEHVISKEDHEGEDSYRTIMDWSKKPTRLSGRGPLNPSANRGFARDEVSVSFPDIRDKAALVAAFKGGYISLVDLRGMFWLFRQHPSVLHYQVIPLLLPHWEEVKFYVLMTNAMGSSGAPAGCMHIHLLLLEIADKLKPGALTTDVYKRPVEQGLTSEATADWRQYIHRPHASKENTFPWVNTRGMIFGRYRTEGRMLKNLLHITPPRDGR